MAASVVFASCGNKDVQVDSTSESVQETVNPGEKEETSGEYIVSDVSFDSTVTVSADDNNKVFYEIFVGSFSDSDGDGIGDLRGIINRMDYLNDGDITSGKSLGIEGIWLSPIFESPSYHKYDCADYYSVDDEFGTNEDLKELVDLCHERGVEVILDLVINHSSTKNQWFINFSEAHKNGDTESEYYDFYSWSTEPVSGRTFRKISGSEDYYECNFSGDMPELNYDNEFVRETMLEVAKYYLTEVGVDGFRFDAAKYIYYGEVQPNVDFWVWYMDELKKIKPDLYTVAEVWDSNSMIEKYQVALNCFDFSTSQADGKITTTAMKGNVNKYTSYVENYINKVKTLNEDGMYIPFEANHDMDRAAGFLAMSTGMGYVGANIYILGPGSPFIYYGEEIGLKGSRGSASTDANRRLAMNWGDGDTVSDPEGADYDEKYRTSKPVTEQEVTQYSAYTYYKRLIMIRKANPEIASGEYTALSFEDTNVGGFVSTLDGSSVCVIHNTTASEQTIDLSKATDLSFNTINAVTGFGEVNASLDGTVLTISPQTSVVLR